MSKRVINVRIYLFIYLYIRSNVHQRLTQQLQAFHLKRGRIIFISEYIMLIMHDLSISMANLEVRLLNGYKTVK